VLLLPRLAPALRPGLLRPLALRLGLGLGVRGLRGALGLKEA
jgi:hypothetical protein